MSGVRFVKEPISGKSGGRTFSHDMSTVVSMQVDSYGTLKKQQAARRYGAPSEPIAHSGAAVLRRCGSC